MVKLRLQIFLVVILFFCFNCVMAQEARFEVDMPDEVVEGASFTIRFTMFDAEDGVFKFSKEIEGLELLYGPRASFNYSRSPAGIVYAESITYEYGLRANSEGTFYIPSASMIVEGKELNTRISKIKVISLKALQEKKLKEIENADIFVKPLVEEFEVDGQKVFELTYRLYTPIGVSQVSKVEYPDLKNFDILRSWTLGGSVFSGEYDGRKYYFVDLKKYVLLPRQSGKICLEGGKIDVSFTIETGRILKTFWGTVPETVDVYKSVGIESTEIDVGLVGDWSAA